MPKARRPSAFKLEPPVATASPPPVAEPTAGGPAAGSAGGRTSVPPGCKAVTFYPSRDGHLQLRLLAGRVDRPAKDLLLDALDLLFAQHNLSRVARPAPKAAAE